MEVASIVNLYKEEPHASNWQTQFLACIVQVKNRTKTPVTECFVPSVCVLFPLAKSMQRMGTCVCFFCHNVWFFAKKISVIFTASCSLPQRLQRQRLLLLGWSNVKRVIFFLHHSCRPVLTVSGVTWLFRSWAKCGHSLAAKVVIKMGKKMRNG